MEIDEVYNEEEEVSLFSSPQGQYEIYVSYGDMYGIVYADQNEAESIRNNIKEDLQKAYDDSREPTDEYIEYFTKKYNLQLPHDTLFDFDLSSIF